MKNKITAGVSSVKGNKKGYYNDEEFCRQICISYCTNELDGIIQQYDVDHEYIDGQRMFDVEKVELFIEGFVGKQMSQG